MKHLTIQLLLGACGIVLWLGTASADDWPQWLGPRRDSVWRETGILEKFPEGGPKVRWRRKVAFGYAGPAVADGRVFVMDYLTETKFTPSASVRDKLQGTERVLCFSVGDGKLLWKHEYSRAYHISFPGGPRVTPTVDGDRVYTLGAEGNLSCLSTKDGSVIWTRDLPNDYHMTTPQWGFAGHPLVDGKKLICLVGGADSVAVAFDKLTGKEIWRALSASEPGYCAPTMMEGVGVRQLLIWHSESVNSLDPETGKVYWSVPIRASYGMSIATPRRDGSYLFAGAIVNKSVLLKLDKAGPSAEVVWRGAKDRGIGPVFSPPLLEDGYLYGVDRRGELRCVKLETGEHVWTTMNATTGDHPASNANVFLVKQNDRFFLANDQGELIIAQLTPAGYHEISRCKILAPTGTAGGGRRLVWSHPAFAQQCVFARNDKEIVCISLAAE